jgi:hypothetical protein
VTNTYLRKYSTSLAIRKMQIKTSLRFHLLPVSTDNIRKTKTTNIGKDTGGNCRSECKLVQQLLKKLKVGLPYDSAVPLLEIDPKESKSAHNRVICTPMFIMALFIIAKLWN